MNTDNSTPTAVTVSEESPEIRRWKLFRNNVSMLARRIRKYQRYALLDDLIQLCEDHGAHANMLRDHEDLGGYAPQSSDSVTVSDRMRALVNDLVMAVKDDSTGPYGACGDFEPSERDLLREIGWLETVIDQRGKRIQALEAQVEFPEDSPMSPIGFPDPAGETPAFNTDPRYSKNPEDSLIAGLPQTRGEEMPAWVTRRVESAREDADFFRRSPDWGLECHALAWLAESRSRLLTALDEKEKELSRWVLKFSRAEQDCAIEMAKNRELRSQLAELQSAVVLQKGELIKWKESKFALEGIPTDGQGNPL